MSRQHGMTRLFVDAALSEGTELTLDDERAHYLLSVLRARSGDPIIMFNPSDGEWAGKILTADRRKVVVEVARQRRPSGPSTSAPPIYLAFALVKRTAAEAIVQKATELGVTMIQPMLCAHSTRTDLKSERLEAICLAAAEQSDRIDLPTLAPVCSFADALTKLASLSHIYLADETGGGQPFVSLPPPADNSGMALIVGPEGGFSVEELDLADQANHLTRIDLGPRILRADTAAIAGLAVLQALHGDWQRPERGAIRSFD